MYAGCTVKLDQDPDLKMPPLMPQDDPNRVIRRCDSVKGKYPGKENSVYMMYGNPECLIT